MKTGEAKGIEVVRRSGRVHHSVEVPNLEGPVPKSRHRTPGGYDLGATRHGQ